MIVAYVECSYRLIQFPTHLSNNGTAINTAGQKRSERYIGYQVAPHGFAQGTVKPIDPIRLAQFVVGFKLQAPVADRLLDTSMNLDGQLVSRRKLLNFFVDAEGRWNILKVQIQI